MSTLFFSLQTIPDVEVGRDRYNLGELNDKGSAKAMFHHRQQQTGSSFLPHYLQKIVSLSVIYMKSDGETQSFSWSGEAFSEKQILEEFTQLIEQYKPTIVSWDNGFDVPVIQYRCLKNSVVSACFLAESGAKRIVDLQSVLSADMPDASTSVQSISALLGLSTLKALDYQDAWKLWQKGEVDQLRLYTEQSVLNTHHVYLRYLLITGRVN